MNIETMLFWFFIFPVYTVPTMFIAMTDPIGAWPLLLWGGSATLVGLMLMEGKRSHG